MHRNGVHEQTMTSVHTVALQRIEPGRVCVIKTADWEQFCRGGAPLLPGDRRIDLLLLTLRNGVCEEIDPITLDLDKNGYLIRIDVGLRPLPRHPTILDARGAFIGRYLNHAHHWQPSEQLIDQALALARQAHL
jgi:hypothetical protein